MYTDAHVHFNGECEAPPAQQFALINSVTRSEWQPIESFCRQNPGASYPFYGVHPWYADRWNEQTERELSQRIKSTARCGIGEIGIDRVAAKKSPDDLAIQRQERMFRIQLAIAVETSRPFSVHCVRAWDLIFDALKAVREVQAPPYRGIVHYFTGSLQIMRALLEYGFYISFMTNIFQPNHKKHLEALDACPRDRLLLETDVLLGDNDSPLKNHYRQTAGHLGLNEAELAALIQQNADRVTA